MKWQEIDYNLERTKIPGGWLVRQHANVSHFTDDRGIVDGYDWRTSICFVPDPEYKWEKG